MTKLLNGGTLAVLIALGLGAYPVFSEPADSLSSSLAPKGVLVRSAILPGWGQYCNHRPFKAVLFGAAAAGCLSGVVRETRALHGASDQEAEDHSARRNTWILGLALTSTLSALDAYVDAQLAGFAVAVHAEPGLALLEIKVTR